jgi:hypothetical protein
MAMKNSATCKAVDARNTRTLRRSWRCRRTAIRLSDSSAGDSTPQVAHDDALRRNFGFSERGRKWGAANP